MLMWFTPMWTTSGSHIANKEMGRVFLFRYRETRMAWIGIGDGVLYSQMQVMYTRSSIKLLGKKILMCKPKKRERERNPKRWICRTSQIPLTSAKPHQHWSGWDLICGVHPLCPCLAQPHCMEPADEWMNRGPDPCFGLWAGFLGRWPQMEGHCKDCGQCLT